MCVCMNMYAYVFVYMRIWDCCIDIHVERSSGLPLSQLPASSWQQTKRNHINMTPSIYHWTLSAIKIHNNSLSGFVSGHLKRQSPHPAEIKRLRKQRKLLGSLGHIMFNIAWVSWGVCITKASLFYGTEVHRMEWTLL